MKVTYYAERINGKIKYFKENKGNLGTVKIEITEREYKWHTAK